MKARDSFGIDLAIKQLLKILGLNDKGEVTLGFYGDFDSCIAAIAQRTMFAPDVPAEQRTALARKAVIETFKSGTLEPKTLSERLRKEQTDYLSTRPTRFVMVSSASIQYDERMKVRKLEGVHIAFKKSIPRKFATPPSLMEAHRRNRLPSSYTAVILTLHARCIYSAAETAFETYDFLRGIWNLYYNSRLWRMHFGAYRPSNEIVAGPIHTLHRVSGVSASETYWFDPIYLEPSSSKSVSPDLPALDAFTRRVRRITKEGELGTFLRKLILRYGRALDERVPATAFLRLWAVLEDATGTAEDERLEVTVRRAAFLWTDNDYHRLVLRDLRTWRNALVHQGLELHRATEIVEELRTYVERLILFLLHNSARFANPKRYFELLDLTPDNAELLRQIQVLRWLHSARHPRPKAISNGQPSAKR